MSSINSVRKLQGLNFGKKIKKLKNQKKKEEKSALVQPIIHTTRVEPTTYSITRGSHFNNSRTSWRLGTKPFIDTQS